MKKVILASLTSCALLLAATPAYAVDTNVKISVKSKDALFIGESVGAAYIIVRDKRDGDILVEGSTTGNSGKRDLVMTPSVARDAVIVDEDTSRFEFSLDIYEPTPVTVEVSGPYGQMQSLAKASADYLLIPGKDYTQGNGIIVEIPGFIVDVMSPPANRKAKFNAEGTLPLQVNVTKLCGCHIDKDTPWPPERYEVEAGIYRGEVLLASIKLEKAEQPGIYGTNLKFEEAGTYRVVVTAFDSKTLEGGMDSTTITLDP
ncbi:MAG: hypothetical protein NDJ24_00950 [Alphaproteobacteria bacterium]|nr:hypothetical protein [Alphaproteobacteria bacterium]